MAKKDSTKSEPVDDDKKPGVEEETPDETDVEEIEDGDEDEEEETPADESEDDETEESDDEEEEADDEEDEEVEEDVEFKKRFTQIKGDSPEEYLPNLEDAYAKSSTEGQRLATELKTANQVIERVNQVMANNPDLAEKLNEEVKTTEPAPVDPTTQLLKQQVEDQMRTDYDSFMEEHPEFVDNEPKAKELNDALAVVRDHVWKSENRVISMGEGLKRAYKLISEEEVEDKTRMAAKQTAAQGRSSSSKKPKASGSGLTDAQIEVSKQLGLDPTEVAKFAAKNG